MKKRIIIYHNDDFIYRCIFKYFLLSIPISQIDMVIDENGNIHILSINGIMKKKYIIQMKSELINNLNLIKVANQNSYKFEEH